MNIDSIEACSTPAFSWSTPHNLATGDDYHFCLQDHEASSVRGCAVVNISAGEIYVEVDPVSVHAGESIGLSWNCSGPERVQIALCKGGPCSYDGGTADPHFIMNLGSSYYCDHRSGYTWLSTHTLASGSDYHLCMQDQEASSVRGCTVVNISAGEIDVGGLPFPIYSGDVVELSWTCKGPERVRITLCKGGPCSYDGGSADPHYYMNIYSGEYCDHRAGYAWSVPYGLSASEDYFVCIEDDEASSVRGCIAANSSSSIAPDGPSDLACDATSLEVYGGEIQAPALPPGGEATAACPIGSVGLVFMRCVAGNTRAIDGLSTCQDQESCLLVPSDRRLEMSSLLPADILSQTSCTTMVHGNKIIG
eukprot:5559631-Amphidinium_carterae.1